MLDRLVARVLKEIHNRPLPPATDAERTALADLREAFRSIPVMNTVSALPSERAWLANMNRLRELVLTRDPRRFLRWDVVAHTMFLAHAPYVRMELRYLQSRPDWSHRWSRAIGEDSVGDPNRYFFYPASSANLIHHAYHLAQFEERSGCRVDQMDDIVEFGGGYGSMCRLVHRLGFAGRYLIFDLPAFSALQRFFLESLSFPVVAPPTWLASRRGVCCTSEIEVFESLCADAARSDSPMFLATWSLSEAPLSLRDHVMRSVSRFKAFLIGYQDRFGEVDNLAAFDALTRSTTAVSWQNVPFEPSKGNRYLIGTAL